MNLHYHYRFTNTDITPYISAGIGSSIEDGPGKSIKGHFLYKISSGVNFPISSRTNVFAGYSLLNKFEGHDYGLELGVNFNL